MGRNLGIYDQPKQTRCQTIGVSKRPHQPKGTSGAENQLLRRCRLFYRGVELLEVGDEVGDPLLVLDARIDHLGPRVLDGVPEGRLVPGQAGVLVGLLGSDGRHVPEADGSAQLTRCDTAGRRRDQRHQAIAVRTVSPNDMKVPDFQAISAPAPIRASPAPASRTAFTKAGYLVMLLGSVLTSDVGRIFETEWSGNIIDNRALRGKCCSQAPIRS
jgi:hypothetical protein